MARTEYLRLIAALPAPSPGRARRIRDVLQAIEDGHARLAAGDYPGAINYFKDAVARAGSKAPWGIPSESTVRNQQIELRNTDPPLP